MSKYRQNQVSLVFTMEFIFQNFEANLALVNEEHCGNLKYWDDAQREVKQCINNISSFKEDQQKLHIIR